MGKLKHIMIGGLAVVASALTMQAQTLTQDWKVTEGLPSQDMAWQGVGYNGKIYTNDSETKSIVSFDGTTSETLIPGQSGEGFGITRDSKGNLIVVKDFFSMRSLVLYNATTKESKTVDITLPDGDPSFMVFLGRAVGDVFSEEGGALFIIGKDKRTVWKISIANGEQVEAGSFVLTELPFTADGMTFVQPLTEDPGSIQVAVRYGFGGDFYTYDGSYWNACTQVGNVSTAAGGDVVTLNGTLYTIEPAGTDYRDGFQIVDRSTNTVVAEHEASDGVVSSSLYPFTTLSAEKVDEYTARIYQYHGGAFAAQYTFSLPKPTYPKMYILGQNEEGEAWDPTRGIEMTTDDGIWYTATVTTVAGRENFAIVRNLAENNDAEGWEYVNQYRYGLAEDNQDAAVAESMMTRRNQNAMRLGIGTFFIKFGGDFNSIYVVPTRLYVFGNSNNADGHDWDPADVSYMAESDPATPGVFTFSPIDLKVEGKAVGEEGADDLSYFAFKTNADGDFDAANGNRWCPDNKNGEMTDNTVYRGFGKNTNGAFCIKNGAYELTVDLNMKTVKAIYLTATSVEEVEGTAARVIAADGTIRIDGEASSVSVYNAAGQAVAVNTTERTLSVARGMYVVVVDGHATKVVVR